MCGTIGGRSRRRTVAGTGGPDLHAPPGRGRALIPRTPAITDAYHELLAANRQRLARWEPWAAEAPTREGTRTFLEAGARAWLEGAQLPVAIALAQDGAWRLVGSAGLRIDTYREAAEAGYWIDGAHEGRGLVTRATAALLDQAFGPLRLARVGLRIQPDNERSRAVAERLGFTEEGVEREALGMPGGRRDDMLYGLLAREWAGRSSPAPG